MGVVNNVLYAVGGNSSTGIGLATNHAYTVATNSWATARVGITLAVILVGAAQIGCALVLTAVALAIDLLILTPVLAVTHGVLRNWLPA